MAGVFGAEGRSSCRRTVDTGCGWCVVVGGGPGGRAEAEAEAEAEAGEEDEECRVGSRYSSSTDWSQSGTTSLEEEGRNIVF